MVDSYLSTLFIGDSAYTKQEKRPEDKDIRHGIKKSLCALGGRVAPGSIEADLLERNTREIHPACPSDFLFTIDAVKYRTGSCRCGSGPPPANPFSFRTRALPAGTPRHRRERRLCLSLSSTCCTSVSWASRSHARTLGMLNGQENIHNLQPMQLSAQSRPPRLSSSSPLQGTRKRRPAGTQCMHCVLTNTSPLSVGSPVDRRVLRGSRGPSSPENKSRTFRLGRGELVLFGTSYLAAWQPDAPRRVGEDARRTPFRRPLALRGESKPAPFNAASPLPIVFKNVRRSIALSQNRFVVMNVCALQPPVLPSFFHRRPPWSDQAPGPK